MFLMKAFLEEKILNSQSTSSVLEGNKNICTPAYKKIFSIFHWCAYLMYRLICWNICHWIFTYQNWSFVFQLLQCHLSGCLIKHGRQVTSVFNIVSSIHNFYSYIQFQCYLIYVNLWNWNCSPLYSIETPLFSIETLRLSFYSIQTRRKIWK